MLKPGDRLTLCRKVMGRKKGEPLVRVAEVMVLSATREVLESITMEEVAREGFPGWDPDSFIEFFCRTHRGCTPYSTVTRIEWAYL